MGRGPISARRPGLQAPAGKETLPILDEVHDFAHPVESDGAWSESYYFNCYDPDADIGLFTRIGVRPNEGTIDVGLSVWLPGGGSTTCARCREQREMIDEGLDVGGVATSCSRR